MPMPDTAQITDDTVDPATPRRRNRRNGGNFSMNGLQRPYQPTFIGLVLAIIGVILVFLLLLHAIVATETLFLVCLLLAFLAILL